MKRIICYLIIVLAITNNCFAQGYWWTFDSIKNKYVDGEEIESWYSKIGNVYFLGHPPVLYELMAGPGEPDVNDCINFAAFNGGGLQTDENFTLNNKSFEIFILCFNPIWGFGDEKGVLIDTSSSSVPGPKFYYDVLKNKWIIDTGRIAELNYNHQEQWILFNIIFDGKKTSVFINNKKIKLDGDFGNLQPQNILTIGYDVNFAPENRWGGALNEVFVFNFVLRQNQRQMIFNYLKMKYGYLPKSQFKYSRYKN